MYKTIVLGGGISALAYLFYYPEAIALAGDKEKLGGMLKVNQNFGPQYLWADHYTEHLLKSLGLDTGTHYVQVGVLSRGDIYYPHDALPIDTALNYALKTRGTKPKGSYMSSGQREYKVHDISPAKVIAALMDHAEDRLIMCSAHNVSPLAQIVADDKLVTYKYDKLVSTIPAPVFCRLANMKQYADFQSRDKYYASVALQDCSSIIKKAFCDGLNYLYCPDLDVPHHRVTFYPENTTAVFEFTGDIVEAPLFSEVHRQQGGQIISGSEILKGLPRNVEFLGRYAQWEHSVKFNDVLRKILEAK